MAEKRKLAFYIRLSDADEEVKAGTKDESNSITGQRKLLYAYIKKTEEFAGFEVLEYFDDGYSVIICIVYFMYGVLFGVVGKYY